MVSFPRPKRARAQTGQVIALFGNTQSGTSTVINLLCGATTKATGVITVAPDTTLQEITDAIDEHRADKKHTIFLDGCPRSAADIQYLFDHSYLYVGSGAVIHVRRGLHAIDAKTLTTFETLLREYDISYFTVINEPGKLGLASAVEQLATYTQITA